MLEAEIRKLGEPIAYIRHGIPIKVKRSGNGYVVSETEDEIFDNYIYLSNAVPIAHFVIWLLGGMGVCSGIYGWAKSRSKDTWAPE